MLGSTENLDQLAEGGVIQPRRRRRPGIKESPGANRYSFLPPHGARNHRRREMDKFRVRQLSRDAQEGKAP